MTNEEKVKAYDEAMNKIKPLYEQAKRDGNPIWSTYEYLIPELAESEDERIRKALIEVFKEKLERGFEWVEYGIPNRSVLDWLEKQKDEEGYEAIPVESTFEYKLGFKAGKDSERQKEQKPTECLKAEKDGWYVCIKDFYGGGKKQCSVGDLVQAKGGMYMMGREDISEWFRRAYYEEVRDVFEPNTYTNIAEWSEKDSNIAEELYDYFYYLQLTSDKEFSPSLSIDEILNWFKSLRPQKLDASKLDNFDPVDVLNRIKTEWPMAWEKAVGKQVWSKEDKDVIDEAAELALGWGCPNLSAKLKSILSRVKPAEWSEEDEKMLEAVDESLYCYESGKAPELMAQIETERYWLQSLSSNLKKKNEDVAKLCSNEWSEEDENIFNDILVDMADRREMFKSNGEIEFAEDTQKKIDWLSSYLPKFQSSYPQQKSAKWSDEDEKMLLSIINAFRNGTVSTIGQEQWLKSLPERFNLEPKLVWSDEDEKEAEKAATDYADEYPGMTHENDGSTVEDYDKPYRDFLRGVHWTKTKIENLRKNILM